MSDTSSTYTGMSGAGGGNLLRITGMATGLDVDGMVKKMMAAEQVKVDKAKQDRQYVQWRQSAYQDIIKDIKDLQNTYFNVTGGDTYLLSSNNYSAFEVNNTQNGVLTATANIGAAAGTYHVNVLNVAQGATVQGTSLNSQASIDTSSANFAQRWAGKTINMTIDIPDANGNPVSTATSITIDPAFNGNFDDLVNHINSKVSGNSLLKGNLSVSSVIVADSLGNVTSTSLKFNGSSTSNIKIVGDPAQLGALDASNPTLPDELNSLKGKVISTPSQATKLSQLNSSASGSLTLKLNYNGTQISPDISIDANQTIGDLITKINTATSGNITAKIDDLTGQFVLQTKSTGSTSTIDISGSSPELLSALGIATTNGQGQDAKVSLTTPDGNVTTMTQTKNVFTINNITYNVSSKGTTDLTVSTNVDKVFNKIKGFIDKYNAIVEKVGTKINEKKSYDYKPLTDSQRSTMKDADIQAWESKAKEGILKNDDNLQNMLYEMRNVFFKGVEGVGITFGSKTLGLDTSNDPSDGGKIEFVDGGEQVLKDAIRDRGQDVMKLFTQSSNADNSTDKYNQQGILQRLNDIVVKNVGIAGTSLNSAILTKYANYQDDFSRTGTSGTNTLPDQIYQKDQLIKNLASALNDKQEKYYQMFSRLETAMNQLNSQSAWLSQQLGG